MWVARIQWRVDGEPIDLEMEYCELENNSEFGTSGFSAIPTGHRSYGNGLYNNMGDYRYFWSSSENGSSLARYRLVHFCNSTVSREIISSTALVSVASNSFD